MLDKVNRILGLNVSVLIQGESGTGKEVIAKAIHNHDPLRKSGPFIIVNCAAMPENLVEAELFGYHKGAFTGALEAHDGYFKQADGGTLFLDEVGELPLPIQPKLLRVLQDKRVRRIGDYEEVPVDVRVVSATNVDLSQAIQEGRFRSDLYFRLEEYAIHVPPLRQRRQDIIPLVWHFWEQFRRELNKPLIKGISEDVLNWFEMSDWSQNNIRELRKALRYAIINCDGEEVNHQHLPIIEKMAHDSLKDQLQHIERRQLEGALKQTSGNIAAAARLLGMSRSTLYDHLKKLSIICR